MEVLYIALGIPCLIKIVTGNDTCTSIYFFSLSRPYLLPGLELIEHSSVSVTPISIEFFLGRGVWRISDAHPKPPPPPYNTRTRITHASNFTGQDDITVVLII